MRLISRLMKRDQMKPQRMLQVYPVFRICTVILCVLLCSLSQNALFTGLIIAGEICITALLEPRQIIDILKTVIPAVLFTWIILLPAVFLGSPSTAASVTMKVYESVTALAILNETCEWKDMTGSLQAVHVPEIVIMTLDMTINFLVILSRFSNRMLEAVTMRAVGDTSWKDSQIGGILGTTFLKSQRMADRTSEAMACRGFEGRYQFYEKHHFQWLDLLYLFLPIGLILLFIYTESLI